MGPVMGAKVSRELAASVAGRSDDEEIDVIVEVQGNGAPAAGSRAERITAMKLAFSQSAEDLRRTVADLGGRVVDEAWINQTLRTRVPKRALAGLEADDRVALLDAPRTLHLDGSS